MGFTLMVKGDLGAWGTTEREGHVGPTKIKTRKLCLLPLCEPGTDLTKHHSEPERSTGPARHKSGQEPWKT